MNLFHLQRPFIWLPEPGFLFPNALQDILAICIVYIGYPSVLSHTLLLKTLHGLHMERFFSLLFQQFAN